MSSPTPPCVLVYGSVNCDEFFVVDQYVMTTRFRSIRLITTKPLTSCSGQHRSHRRNHLVDLILAPGGQVHRRGGRNAFLALTSGRSPPGGKGANQAVAAARAGAKVDFAGAIGPDGDWLKAELEAYGVDTRLLVHDEQVRLADFLCTCPLRD